MSQVSYGTITIVDTNDIESITIEYARNQSTSNPPDKDSGGWNTTRPSWEEGYYIWQRARIHKSGTDSSTDTFGAAVCLTGSTGQIGETGPAGQSLIATKTQYTNVANNITITKDNHTSYTWTDDVPEYNVNKPAYWGRITNTYSNPSNIDYLIYKDNGLTDAIAKSVEANTKSTQALSQSTSAQETVVQINNLLGGHFSSGAALTQLTPGGAWIIEQVKEDGVDLWGVPSKWHHNVTIGSNGINLRYNEAVMAQLAANQNNNTALTFYQPPIINEGTTTQGKKTLELSNSALIFYNPNDGVTTAATLSSTGLNIVDGSISLGATGSDRVHLSTKDLSSAIEINGQSTTEWRLLLGDKFGVTKAGYMNAGSGKIGGWSIGTDTNKSLYYSNSTPGASTNNLVLSPSSAKNTNAIGGSAANLTWFISAGQAFGVTTAGKLYATGVNISGEIIADSGKIGGLILEESSIHSNEKTLNNNVAGIYIDGLGQFNTGDGVNYIKSWKDSSDNKWKISLRASEMLFSSGANVEDELITAKSDAETAKASIDKEINGYLSIVVESSIYEESAIEIDAEKYGSSFGAGTNTFTYTNNHWYLNGSLVTEEDFSNYGMTIKQTPVEGDSFNVISTNVESLSSSLTNLREEVNSNSDSISNLITYTESNTSNISALSEESSATTETVDDLTTQVQELSDALYGEKTEREARMTFGTDSAGDPILTLGGGAHSDFQMNLTNLELAFKEKNYTVASISGHVLTIENANVSSQLQMGNFAWIPRKNGHLTLKYIG